MFDLGFLELLLIGIIALIILGPERLPKAAKKCGLWIAKARHGFESVKSEIDRELQLQELQTALKKQQQQLEKDSGFHQVKQTLAETDKIVNNGDRNEPLINSLKNNNNEINDKDSINENDSKNAILHKNLHQNRRSEHYTPPSSTKDMK
jgi:sec-independent protein translocase protein TatB